MSSVSMLFLLALAIVLGVLCLLAAMTQVVAGKIARGFTPNGQFIDIDGTRIHYVERGPDAAAGASVGARPAIVMVHGLNGQLRHFTHSLLARLAPDYRVILLDRPGAGHSSALPGGRAGLRAQADLVAAFIARLGLQRPLLVGHSLGGAVALATALDHPERVGALALVAPLTQVETTAPSAFKALTIESAPLRWLYSRLFLLPVAMRTGQATLAMVFGPEPAPADFPTAGGGLLSLRPDTYLAASADLRGVAEDLPGLVARYGTLRLPIAVLYGRQDGILDWQRHGKGLQAQVPAAQLDTVDGGHMLPLTQPDVTAAFIRRAAEALPA